MNEKETKHFRCVVTANKVTKRVSSQLEVPFPRKAGHLKRQKLPT